MMFLGLFEIIMHERRSWESVRGPFRNESRSSMGVVKVCAVVNSKIDPHRRSFESDALYDSQHLSTPSL